MKKILLIIFSISLLIIPVYAQEAVVNEDADDKEIEELEKKIQEYEKKIDSLKQEAQTLSRDINTFNNQIYLTQLKVETSIRNISRTEKQIERLSGDIGKIADRIDQLINRIDYQKNVLQERIRERYKTRETNPIMVIFGSTTINDLVKKSAYLRVMELQDNKVLTQMNSTKTTYDRQKKLFEDKKDEEEQLQASLLVEKANLDSYKNQLEQEKTQKQALLNITNNDEARFQELLQKAQRELASYASFVEYAGGGVIEANAFGKGKEGWYLSQRDSRWAGRKIGKSNYTVYEVGCLITSVAMVYKKSGYDVSPADIASENSRYFSNTAMMLIPWIGPKGKSYNAISTSQINSELNSGRPVVVGVYAGPYGTHFVVLSSVSGSDYIMYDPFYGPDLKFSDYYSKGSIYQAVVFK